MSVFPNVILASYFMGTNKTVSKFMWQRARFRLDNGILLENKVGGLILSHFNIWYKITVIKRAQY